MPHAHTAEAISTYAHCTHGCSHINCRNVTVTGPGGRLPVLDLGFVPEVVTLGPNAWLTVAGIAITRTRRSTGESFDSIVGTEEPGAVLVLQNVVKQRVACTPPQDTAAVLLETDRSSLVPNSTSGKQEFSLGTTTYRVRGSRATAAGRERTPSSQLHHRLCWLRQQCFFSGASVVLCSCKQGAQWLHVRQQPG